MNADTHSAAAAAASAGTAHSRGLLGRLVALAVVLLLGGQIALAWFALNGFERELEPQLNQKARDVGLAVSDQFQYAVGRLQIPPAELVGVDAFFDKILALNADIEYLLLQDLQSQVLFARGLDDGLLARMRGDLPGPQSEFGATAEVAGFVDAVFPVQVDGEVVTALHVGISRAFIRSRLSEILFEVITVIIISWLVTLEFLRFFMNTRVAERLDLLARVMGDGARGGFANRLAMRARDEIGNVAFGFNRLLRDLGKRFEDFKFEVLEVRGAQIDDGIAHRIQSVFDGVAARFKFAGGAMLLPRSAMQIRIPLFLFIFAEELSRSFLPLFVAQFSPQTAAVSDEFLIGLPITLFMLVVAVVTPLGGGLVERFGARRIFLAGLAFAVIGYVGIFFVRGYYDFLLWRGLGGVGYGLLFIAAQMWVTEHSTEERRAQGMAVFTGAVFVGAICGPPIGSIVADRIGFAATFLISAALSILSALIVHRILQEGERDESEGGAQTRRAMLGWGEWRMLLSDGRFFALTILSAVPAKLVLTGLLFYLVPLYLNALGNPQSAIGWVVMLYGVATVSCTSLAAKFADRRRNYAFMITVGGLLAGVGGLAALSHEALGGETVAVIIAVVALGLGHALSLTSQLTVAQRIAENYAGRLAPASVVAAFRFVERAGLVVGPLIAGALVAAFDYRQAMVGLGLIMLVSIGLFGLVWRLSESAGGAAGRQAEAA